MSENLLQLPEFNPAGEVADLAVGAVVMGRTVGAFDPGSFSPGRAELMGGITELTEGHSGDGGDLGVYHTPGSAHPLPEVHFS